MAGIDVRAGRLVVAAGTYDGVLAGWELKKGRLKLEFATAVHSGSVRSVSLTTSPNDPNEPGSLLSSGYDETLKTHDWHKRMTSSGEVRTPPDFGTPTCSSFAPPLAKATHCVMGFSNGKIAIYKKRDWSVEHVLAGHEGGVSSLAVHPSGKLALTGGTADGKLKLWDLTKGRLAFVNKVTPSSNHDGRTRYSPIDSLIWTKDGSYYGMAYGPHITVRDVATGKDLLDVHLPSRANQITFMSGPEGLFVAAACNDGSLPVLSVEDSDDENRRAIMAIEPIEGVIAREERYKCISSLAGYCVVVANSAGVISLMDLRGAVRMITTDEHDDDGKRDEQDENSTVADEDSETSDSDGDGSEQELAVDIIDSSQLGTGARVTCLTAWFFEGAAVDNDIALLPQDRKEDYASQKVEDKSGDECGKKDRNSKRKRNEIDIAMDAATVAKARKLVSKAKKIKKRRADKKKLISLPVE